jgi:hypothetical protein
LLFQICPFFFHLNSDFSPRALWSFSFILLDFPKLPLAVQPFSLTFLHLSFSFFPCFSFPSFSSVFSHLLLLCFVSAPFFLYFSIFSSSFLAADFLAAPALEWWRLGGREHGLGRLATAAAFFGGGAVMVVQVAWNDAVAQRLVRQGRTGLLRLTATLAAALLLWS